jgi:hypothetical protein
MIKLELHDEAASATAEIEDALTRPKSRSREKRPPGGVDT